ncbi:MAG: YlxR family protein [Bacilli bacterium]|nr:YlxR family protein [Bacilli bacterium]
MQRVNTRMDALTRKSFPKESCFRFVKKEGRLVLSPSEGRGIYIHKSLESIERLSNPKMVEKRLGVKVETSLIETLKEAL